jgi:DNA-directed RNA polymerase alpha subunit
MTPGQEKITLDTALAEHVSTKTANRLEDRGMLYVRDLRGKTKEDLLSIPNFGNSSLAEVLALMREWHYQNVTTRER